MTIRGGDIIKRVARFLTDYDSTDASYQYVEWSKEDLVDYLYWSAMTIAAITPSASVGRFEYRIPDDGIIELPSGCSNLIKVLGFKDTDGVVHTPVNLVEESSSAFVIAGAVCPPSSSRGSNSVTVRINRAAGDSVSITPATARGTLILSCNTSPVITGSGELTEVGLDVKYEPVLRWWMISKAFGTDVEAVPLRERSDVYWDRGLAILYALHPEVKTTIKQK